MLDPLWFKTFLVLAVCFTAGCTHEPDKPTLRLLCGAGLQPPAEDLAAEFGRQQSVIVECDFAGSEVLLSRIKLTDQGDLFLPGDVHYVQQAENEGLILQSRTVCHFVPVILVQKGNPRNIHSIEDLTRPDIKLGLGDPQACAIGRKSAKIFQKNEIDESTLNVAFRSLTVNELGNHVSLKTLDAAIVWDAVAALASDKTDVVSIPLEQNVISTVAIGVLKRTEHPELTEKFLDFVVSEPGRAILKQHHYTLDL